MDSEPVSVEFTWRAVGSTGRVCISVKLPGGSTCTDKIDITDSKERAKFIEVLLEKYPGLDVAEVGARLESIASDALTPSGEADAGGSQKDRLVALVKERGVDLFHTPGGQDAEPHATFQVGDHRETWRIHSMGFRLWLSREYYAQYRGVPGSQALQDAISLAAGLATFEGKEHAVAVRLAMHAGEIWLDLCDEKWRAIHVTANGWRIVESAEVPVRFVRRRGMLALPVPVQGGALPELRELVNVGNDDNWILLVAALVGFMRPLGPYVVLVVNGEQGSAKSVLCKLVRRLIDPNKLLLRRPPREDRDLAIAAQNSWIVGYDNLSGLQQWLSDSLCSLATGGGFGTRELYANDEEKLFDVKRPVILNGIEDVAARSDLLDRAIVLMLPGFVGTARKTEEHLLAEFEARHPRILGALLDAVSTALRNFPTTSLRALPRMADFARWVAAAEPALPWGRGDFMRAYLANRAESVEAALEASVIATALLTFMEQRERWEGSLKELLEHLRASVDEENARSKDWPRTPRGLRNSLQRAAPNLRAVGIHMAFGGRTTDRNRTRLVRIDRTDPGGGPPSGRSSDDSGRSPDVDRPQERAHGGPADAGSDGADGVDGAQPPPSKRGPSHSSSEDGFAKPRHLEGDSAEPSAASGPSENCTAGPENADSCGRSSDGRPADSDGWGRAGPCDAPATDCFVCDSTRFWRLIDEGLGRCGPWRCERCHPPGLPLALIEYASTQEAMRHA